MLSCERSPISAAYAIQPTMEKFLALFSQIKAPRLAYDRSLPMEGDMDTTTLLIIIVVLASWWRLVRARTLVLVPPPDIS